jgi:hypothetical protein
MNCARRRVGISGGSNELRPYTSPARMENLFFLVNGAASYAPCGTNPIEMTNTDRDAEPFLQGCLHLATPHVGCLTTKGFQELAHRFAQFDWMATAKLLTLFRPATGQLRAKGVLSAQRVGLTSPFSKSN